MKKNNNPTPREKRTGDYWKKLNQVMDPELNLGIVDLGLIYNLNIDKKGNAKVVMTLTSPVCPSGPEIMEEIKSTLTNFKGIKKVKIELVWDPAWSPDMMDEILREILFG